MVFEAWTQPKHLRNWMFSKKAFTCEYVSADITPRGAFLHKMTAPNGHEMWLLTKYEAVNPQLIWEPVSPTQAEAAVFEASRDQHSSSWDEGLDQLVAYCETL
ncbi:SRPBCC family protein [Adonisia turfae]|uniref:SRPBCC family protein n=1 Tax=Adonisia turfae TaxID=2950184 RepID=UPI00254290A8|nr:SRPBCC domain-containing protein [Adonisia turfae]